MKPSEIQSICVSNILAGIIAAQGTGILVDSGPLNQAISKAEEAYRIIKIRAIDRCLPKEQTKEVDG